MKDLQSVLAQHVGVRGDEAVEPGRALAAAEHDQERPIGIEAQGRSRSRASSRREGAPRSNGAASGGPIQR
jgi:hypothetical protein